LGDDVVPVCSADTLVWPLPTALSIKRGVWSLVSGIYPELTSQASMMIRDREVRFLPLHYAQHEPLPICALVFPFYQPEHHTSLSKISTPTALALLMESNSWFGYPLQKRNIVELVELIEHLPKYTLRYCDVKDAASKITTMLTESSCEPMASA
jgi:hypothetical protein